MNVKDLYERRLIRYRFTDEEGHPLHLCADFEAFLTDVRRAERERCAEVCRTIEEGTVTTSRTCADAIEALEDEP